MFSWNKNKDPVSHAVDLVHKAMLRGWTKTKITSRSKMREQVLEAVHAHPTLQVKVGEPECVPQIVRQKLKIWDEKRVLVLDGSVQFDGPGQAIPLQVLVHGEFPTVFPICIVTGDLYVPKWDAERCTLKTMIGTIILECAQTRFLSGSNTLVCGPQVEGVILSADDDFDWQSFEAARRAQEAITAKRKSLPRTPAKKHSIVFAVTDDTPSTFVCPISLEVMVEPVTAADGHTYERGQIEAWLSSHSTSPLTNEEMTHTNLLANTQLQTEISEYKLKLASGARS